jgi:L-histidine Nalpha-methyltransferase
MSEELRQFLEDTDKGLSKEKKALLSKYFYDAKGSELFNLITQHPSYYLTNCELEILETNKKNIADYLQHTPFNLIELGPGEGIKTKILINQFLQNGLSFQYVPIDISPKYLVDIKDKLVKDFPTLRIEAVSGDFFTGLKWQSAHSGRRNLVLFLGSSIGNFKHQAIMAFLSGLHDSLHAGDYLLLGFDLIKDRNRMLEAYNDPSGLTRNFNFNHLTRINRELGGDFDLNNYEHCPTYNEESHAMESFLVSRRKHRVHIKQLNKSFSFEKDEQMNMEYSHKYSMEAVEQYANENGFTIIANYTDPQNYFVDSLWQVV